MAEAKTRAVRSVPNDWHEPQCAEAGLPWLRFVDRNDVLHRGNADPAVVWRQPFVWTSALAIGATPNVLWAVTTDGAIRQSADAGCTWTVRATVPELLLDRKTAVGITARHAGVLFVWTGNHFFCIAGATTETFAMPTSAAIVKLDADPSNASHLRAVTQPGAVYDSVDGASTWKEAGFIPTSLVNAAAFDPSDFNHILAATNGGGLHASHDGGKSWHVVAVPRQQVFAVIFSPANPRVVWTDAWPGPPGAPSTLYRSNDGGETFVPVASNPNSLSFTSFSTFAPHPRDPETYALRANPGIQVISPAGRKWLGYENPAWPIWSPSGTLYFIVDVVVSL